VVAHRITIAASIVCVSLVIWGFFPVRSRCSSNPKTFAAPDPVNTTAKFASDGSRNKTINYVTTPQSHCSSVLHISIPLVNRFPLLSIIIIFGSAAAAHDNISKLPILLWIYFIFYVRLRIYPAHSAADKPICEIRFFMWRTSGETNVTFFIIIIITIIAVKFFFVFFTNNIV